MSKEENKGKNCINKKLIKFIGFIFVIIGTIFGVMAIINPIKNIEITNSIENTNNKLNNEIENIENVEVEVEVEEENENETPNDKIIITNISNSIYYEFINTNYVDDFTFFTTSSIENNNGGNYKVITSYKEYEDFMSNNNIDTSNDKFTKITEKYFEKNVIICVIDSYEEIYQNRNFFNFCVDEGKTYINYLKTNNDNSTNLKGFWTYMIGVDYDTLGKTEIKKLPINIKVLD